MCKLNFKRNFKLFIQKQLFGQRLFESLKPFFVKPLKDRNTCWYIYHVELNELKLALNLLKTKKYSSWSLSLWLSLWECVWPWWTAMPSIRCGILRYHSIVGAHSVPKSWIQRMAWPCMLVWQLFNVQSGKISLMP